MKLEAGIWSSLIRFRSASRSGSGLECVDYAYFPTASEQREWISMYLSALRSYQLPRPHADHGDSSTSATTDSPPSRDVDWNDDIDQWLTEVNYFVLVSVLARCYVSPCSIRARCVRCIYFELSYELSGNQKPWLSVSKAPFEVIEILPYSWTPFSNIFGSDIIFLLHYLPGKEAKP